MCGIAGYAVNNRRLSPETLNAAELAMLHRGPDDGGVVRLPIPSANGELGLAHRRLAILDLSSSGHQPMVDVETGNCIAYNGEVFNFRQIRTELQSLGLSFKSETDTEVILKAYGVWGLKCLDRFRGMFAIAIWDKQRERLFLARDRFGIKPLYYYLSGGDLFFASEVRTLLGTGAVPAKISNLGVLNYLTFGSVAQPNTLIDGVMSLPPGTYMLWSKGSCEIHEYWDLISATQGKHPAASLPDQELLPELSKRLREAVELRMVSDVPVSVFLSGGIDSSAMVAMLANSSPHALQTFSVIFAEQDFSEAKYSRVVAERFHTDHHDILLRPRSFLEAIPEGLAALDQPSLDGLNSYIISREVRAAGFKVALSGLGSDEIFAGYGTFRLFPRLERYQSRLRHVPGFVRKAFAAGIRRVPGAEVRLEKLAGFVDDSTDIVSPYVISRSLFPLSQQRCLARQWQTKTFDASISSLREMVKRAAGLHPVNRLSYLELSNYVPNTLLRDTDSMSMAHSIEVRVPFLDHELVGFVFSIAGERKVQNGTPKPLLTSAMAGLLPPEIVNRPKRGFVLPFETWLRKDLRRHVEENFSTWEQSAISEHIDGKAVRSVWNEFLAGRTTWSRVWALFVLRQWVQLHIEDSLCMPALSNEEIGAR